MPFEGYGYFLFFKSSFSPKESEIFFLVSKCLRID